ncbi:MAG: Holliday junction branch migration protein RuvA [Pseudomonadota bacterium]
MIGKIAGRLEMRGADHVLIDTGGVGYVVYCSDRTLAAMPALGATVALYTELLVREDLLQLFGFLTPAEKEWHRLLTSVQGIGAKGALALLGTLGADGVARAISLGDISAVRAAPGIGPKTAQRVVLELKDKAAGIMALGAAGAQTAMVSGAPETPRAGPAAPPDPAAMAPRAAPDAAARADALSALANLGYPPGEAATALAAAEADGAQATADLIRTALKHLAPKP